MMRSISVKEMSIILIITCCSLLNSVLAIKKINICVPNKTEDVYKKKEKYCNFLSSTLDFGCILGVDKMDCIRKIHKNEAQFGLLTSEDLLAARWYGSDLLVVAEIKYSEEPFEYEVVAVVDNDAKINTVHDLKGKKLCHPGYGLSTPWPPLIANYLETVMTDKHCDENMTLCEARLKASQEYFGASCKAGPWSENKIENRVLKKKYSSLCQRCYKNCDAGDKHWGRQGTLNCLTSGGDIAWARLDDVRAYFTVLNNSDVSKKPSGYSFLCLDGHLQPLFVKKPCSWVEKPWPVVAAKREYFETVRQTLQDLFQNSNNSSIANKFLMLLEPFYVNITFKDDEFAINDYLYEAYGYQSAYSFHQCNPTRSVVFCTSSVIEYNKCVWLEESSNVMGVEPNIQCIRSTDTNCMLSVENSSSDIAVVRPDKTIDAMLNYKLAPMLFEFGSVESSNIVIAVTNKNIGANTIADIRNKKICIPQSFQTGLIAVFATIKHILHPDTNVMKMSEFVDFFAKESCLSDIYRKSCKMNVFTNNDALECLNEGYDIAFVDYKVVKEKLQTSQYFVLCLDEFTKNVENICYVRWYPSGSLMVKENIKEVRKQEIFDTMKSMERLFGKNSKNDMFKLFGDFDGTSDILFKDSTEKLIDNEELQSLNIFNSSINYESFISSIKLSNTNESSLKLSCSYLVLLAIIFNFLGLCQ